MNTTSTTVTDPVCGMQIDPEKAAGASSFGGQTYHFCSRSCETKFDAQPAHYAAAPAAATECCTPAAACCSDDSHTCC